jgi:hypothetical protein
VGPGAVLQHYSAALMATNIHTPQGAAFTAGSALAEGQAMTSTPVAAAEHQPQMACNQAVMVKGTESTGRVRHATNHS